MIRDARSFRRGTWDRSQVHQILVAVHRVPHTWGTVDRQEEPNYTIPFPAVRHGSNVNDRCHPCGVICLEAEFNQLKCFALAWIPFRLAATENVLNSTRRTHKKLTARMVRPTRAELEVAPIALVVVAHHTVTPLDAIERELREWPDNY